MANMYLICGPSGVGKTTFSKRFSTHHNMVRFDIDEFYAIVNGSELNRNNKFEVWIEFFKAIHNAEINNIDCVIEASGITRHQRREFVEWFPSFNHHLIFIMAESELREKNNSGRKRQVPGWRMKDMSSRMQLPILNSDDALFDTLSVIVNENNIFQEPVMYKGTNELLNFNYNM